MTPGTLNAERLLALYERVADAPDAIARLRRFVLDLAVRGKLVEQDPNDEPASDLLERIAAEKARLVDAGEIKKPKSLSLADSPLSVPPKWTLVPLGQVVLKHLGGGTPSKSNDTYWGGEIRWASVKDVGKSKYLDDTIDRITEAGLANSSSNLVEPGNLVVVTRMGLGKVSINRIPVAINQDLRALFLSKSVNIDYAYNFFLTHGFEGTGLTVKGIKLQELLRIPFPLPPLAEQRRIVAKVEELMALLDRLEAARTTAEANRERLTAASLGRLTAPDTSPEAFPAHARFALDALPALTSRPNQIKALRQTILNLAVRGELVEQDPNDEPASVLTRSAVTTSGQEKAALRKGFIVANRADLIFEIPSHWEPIFVSQALQELQTGPFGSSLHKSDYVKGGTPVLNPASIQNGQIRPVPEMAVGAATLERLSSFKVREHDILMARRGEMGRCAVVSKREAGLLCGTGSLILRPSGAIFPEYLALVISSPTGRAFLGGAAVGTTMQNLNQSILLKMPFGLPPLAEQRRIVAKVDDLMALCDRLEAALTSADTTKQRLLESLLHEALTPAATPHELEAAAV